MSAHNNVVVAMEAFKNQKASIAIAFSKQSVTTMSAYRKRLEASIETARWLLVEGLPFRGHDEKETSISRGKYYSLLTLLCEHDPDYKKVVLKAAPGNCQLTSPKIQKDIINACAKETTKAILEELDTTSLTLKTAIESLLMEYSLTLSRVRGQGYDSTSNMQGSINGLKTLILNESPCAYFVHCFAHQLQLTQVALAKKNSDCVWLFVDVLAPLLNFVSGSPKRKEFLREKQAQRVVDALSFGELETGTGLNQELGLGRPCDTRWGSYFKTILNVLDLYPSILESLDAIGEVSVTLDVNRAQ
ncbi:uncharacterized protein [Spinacia oleracea]|uniref:DUF4371 domain-containing protein n=1 Tax=Spinacia oleracea TaxID=3562 RepID=A0A9R0HTR0_SPIOL|nr:uncharacterized protein LOC110776556 [Spinacia oleracea]